MKKGYLTLASLLLICGAAAAQGRPDYGPVCREQMKKLELLAGHWTGEATYRKGPGPGEIIRQEEHIEWKLDSTLLVIEGTGKKTDASAGKDEVVFNAIGLVNYDPSDKAYKFRSFLKEGSYTEAYFTLKTENEIEWGFDVPNGGKVKYRITLDPARKTWQEVGEYSQDGTTWYPFVTLNLKKVG